MQNNIQAVYSEVYSHNMISPRYIVVDITTGEILDDAQGYGYKSTAKAYAGYNYKKYVRKEI